MRQEYKLFMSFAYEDVFPIPHSEYVSVWCHIIFLFVFVILFTGSIPQPGNWQGQVLEMMIRLPLNRITCMTSVLSTERLDDCVSLPSSPQLLMFIKEISTEWWAEVIPWVQHSVDNNSENMEMERTFTESRIIIMIGATLLPRTGHYSITLATLAHD